MSTVPQLRDDETTKAILSNWLSARSPAGGRIEVLELCRPQGSGASNETLLIRTDGAEDGAIPADLVLRIAPTKIDLVMEPRFDLQYRVLEALGRHGGVPVPAMLGYEADASYFGAPFWIMSRVKGRSLTDFPPYNVKGWLFDASAMEQRQVWQAGVETLAAVSRVPADLFDFLDDPGRGEGGLRQLLQYWRDALDWASVPYGDPVLEQVYDWLVVHFPAAPVVGLSWGDARIGNLLFDGGRCTAVLDWELMSLGGPLVDLAYWLTFDEILNDGVGLPRLPGFGSREETIALWQARSGIQVSDLGWYETLAWFRIGCVTLRSAHVCRSLGLAVPEPGNLGCLGDITAHLSRTLQLSTTPGE